MRTSCTLRSLVIASVLCCCSMAIISRAQSLSDQLNKPSNMGMEFYLTFVPCYEETGTNKLMLYIASQFDGVATVAVEGKSFQTTVIVKANDIVPVELGPQFGQAFSKSTTDGIPPEQIYPAA